MKEIIKALDEWTWRSVLINWNYPKTKDDEGKVILKPEVSWSSGDDRLANYNSKALHAIFKGVNVN